MRTKFSLSFGASLIAVGIFNLFFKINSVALFGMTISAFTFSLINFMLLIFGDKFKTDKIEMVYVIPFMILLLFCCFNESLTKITNDNAINVLSFISFGLIFISEYFNYKKEMKISKNFYYRILLNEITYSNLILKKLVDSKDKDSNLYNDIQKLTDAKEKKILLELEFLKLKKDFYSIIDIDEIYTANDEILKTNYKE